MPDGEARGPIRDERTPPRIVSSELAFAGRVWDIRRDVFEYNGEQIARDYVDHSGAVAVLAMDDEGRVLVIQQYRHPIQSRDWELPAGLRDIAHEDPLVAAQRELAEEVDLVASDWTELIDFYTSPGGSNELIKVYLAGGSARPSRSTSGARKRPTSRCAGFPSTRSSTA